MKYFRSSTFAILISTILFPEFLLANVRLPKLVGDNMVLQRNVQIPVWGWADKGEKITVTFNGKAYAATPNPQGKWMVTLPATPAGGPYQMTVAGKNNITIQNILVGDVWLASGQSNMEWRLSATVNNFRSEAATANYPQIRFFDVKDAYQYLPQTDAQSDGWQVCSPATAYNFSAVAYFFGRDLHQKYNVPIGLISTDWGGTPAEAWTSAQALKTLPDYTAQVTDLEKNADQIQKAAETYQKQLAVWQQKTGTQDRGFTDAKPWKGMDVDAKGWQTTTLPGLWEENGLPNYDGIVWYRKEITVPVVDAGKDLTLHLGMIDDMDSTWFNGIAVGFTGSYNKNRVYTVPGKLVKAGRNVIAIRVIDTGGGGGIYGKPEDFKLVPASGTAVSLAGQWQYQTALDIKDMPQKPPTAGNLWNTPTVLYNAMIAPLVPYAIKGAIWYQGESNASRAYQYRKLFPAMIGDWRKQWNQGDFPFLFVQLANFMETTPQPVESDWAELREAQTMTLAIPKTGMAVTIDIGEAKDIHPRNKQDVGKRLAYAAYAVAYGEKDAPASPTFKSMQVEGDNIRLTFDHVGSGLVAVSGELKEFSIAGADKQFVWATARIEGNSVIVSSPQVKQPVAVRYAWANNPMDANLYNTDGLPASPFRTDDWAGITISSK